MKKLLPFLIVAIIIINSLFTLKTIGVRNSAGNKVYAQNQVSQIDKIDQISQISQISRSITVSATVDEHLTWRKEGNNLIVSTNKSEGFTLIIAVEGEPSNVRQKNNIEVISKKGPIVLSLPSADNFILTGGF